MRNIILVILCSCCFIPPVHAEPGKFTPEIGAAADVVFTSDDPDNGEASNLLRVREVELTLGALIESYFRLDMMVTYTEEETVELEEAYATLLALPGKAKARIGRLKPKIGIALALHRDELDTVDEPLVIRRYFGEEGMNKDGGDVTVPFDLAPVAHQITFGVLEGGNGEGGTAFGEAKRRATVYGRWQGSMGISGSTELKIGLSDAIGSSDEDSSFEVNVFGVDAALMHRFDPQQSLKLQGEIFNLDRSESFYELVTDDGVFQQDLDGNIWGGYALLDFRPHPQWAAGYRYDRVEIVDRPVESPGRYDEGSTLYLTFYMNEFVRWRLQYSHFSLTDGSEDDRVMVQATFTFGNHEEEHEH